MFGLFKSKPVIDQDEFDWQLACFKWLLQEFEGLERLRKTPLVLPTVDFFPESKTKGHARATELFDQVRYFAHMTEWPCRLVEGEAAREMHVGNTLLLRHQHKQPPLGTFSYVDGQYQISYNPSEIVRPLNLIATFAHELSHYLMHTAVGGVPGGRELNELATDVSAVFLGFGIFLANTAKTFEQHQDFAEYGWQARRQGYLSELGLVTALSIFVELSGTSHDDARTHLKPYLQGVYKKAVRYLKAAHPDLGSDILALDLSEYA